MKKRNILAVACAGAVVNSMAQTIVPPDTVPLHEVEILATRASSNTPVAFTNLSRDRIDAVNHGKDIPFMLSCTPSVVTTSDAGCGVGYSSMRVRGSDPTRINVTINDIPLNDAESHTVYWVNTPDIASSLQDLQVQRGVGTSTTGAGAFGASINMLTQRFSSTPYGTISASYGSFNTHKETLAAGTGLMRDHWAIDARLSHIASDGYRDRASSQLTSYYAQLGYFASRTSVRFITFGGKENTYHAWDGITRDDLTNNRTYNPNGAIKHNGEVTGYYDNQRDIYHQRHYQLILNHTFSPQWQLKAALHATLGDGYYQEYKNNRTLVEYLLQPIATPSGELSKTNLVRKKGVESTLGGGIFSARYTGHRLHATLGCGINTYHNDHYGRVLWVEQYTAQLDPSHEYYRNTGNKQDYNAYARAHYDLVAGLSAYLDLQYRHIAYRIAGAGDKWDWTASPAHMQVLDVNEKFNFFNPKAGLNYRMGNKHRAYASVAIAHKEPTRNNYTDGLLLEHPRPEKLTDWEVGYEWTGERFAASANLYYMNYTDQLVLNGRLNEIGEPMAENVPHSYRRGIELVASAQLTSWLRWDVNATLSQNRIKDYVGYVSDYNATTWDDMWSQSMVECGNTTLAFSPSFTAGSNINVNYKGLDVTLQSQWVGRQYLDNFENREDSLDPYFVNHLHMAYTFELPHIRSITAGVSIYNLFNTQYETNGYSQTCALYPNGDKTREMILVSDPCFYPMAGTNVLAHITLKF